MKLFGFFHRKKEAHFQLTEADREWVEENFKWLLDIYGYLGKELKPVALNETFFPATFLASTTEVQPIIDDLAFMLQLDAAKISFELQEDLRDIPGMPYEMESPFEADTVIAENAYQIIIAKSLLQHPKRLSFSLIYEFIKIRLSEDKLQYDSGEDTSLFIYLAGVYFGFGVILSQNLVDRGLSSDGFWETKWNYVSEMPQEVMAYALAAYANLINQDNPDWKQQLPGDLKQQFELAIRCLKDRPNQLFDKSELAANDLFEQAEQEYLNNNFDAAISCMQKILFLTTVDLQKAEAYNNIGYYQLRKGAYEQSMGDFKKAIALDANYGFAYDNMGYALIKTGRLEEGKQFLDRALETQNNDMAYTHRNLALYYQAIGDADLAEKNFQLAFQQATGSVDLLELHYGEFLIAQGKVEKGNKFLQEAAAKGES